MGYEISKVKPDYDPSPAIRLIETAIEKGFDAGQLRELVALQREMKADAAADAYAAAITRFAEICPRIMKRHSATIKSRDESKAGYGYQYASFDDIMRAISPALDECKLAISFTTSTDPARPNMLTVICYIRHGIHVEERSFTLPIPAMTVNDTQKFGAGVSYGKRYALTAALNLTTTDVDDDARGLGDTITDDQVNEIKKLIWVKGKTLERVLNFLSVESLEEMNSRTFGLAKDYLTKLPSLKTDDPKAGGYS